MTVPRALFRFEVLRHRTGALTVLWVLVAAICAKLSPYFMRWDTVTGILQFSCVIGLLGLGESLVILGGGGGIDLSVGAILSLVAVGIGFLVKAGLPLWEALTMGMALGTGLGALNGVLVALVGIPPLVASLATLYAYGGLAVALTQGRPIVGFPESFGALAQSSVAGVPLQVLVFLLPAYALGFFVLRYTPFGRHIYLVGNSDIVARLVGVKVGFIRGILYAISGLLASSGAIIMDSWLLTARPDAGAGMELMAITVAVLGGFDIFGGEGSVVGTLMATIVIVTLQNGLQLANINPVWQLGIVGLLLILSVAANQLIVYRG
jgi:ribose/xylose/arabinose/galactoside ABC-type transport system permease subunit